FGPGRPTVVAIPPPRPFAHPRGSRIPRGGPGPGPRPGPVPGSLGEGRGRGRFGKVPEGGSSGPAFPESAGSPLRHLPVVGRNLEPGDFARRLGGEAPHRKG